MKATVKNREAVTLYNVVYCQIARDIIQLTFKTKESWVEHNFSYTTDEDGNRYMEVLFYLEGDLSSSPDTVVRLDAGDAEEADALYGIPYVMQCKDEMSILFVPLKNLEKSADIVLWENKDAL